MKYFISLAAIAGGVSGQIGAFVAPGPGDLRGPCPGLNMLANHGLLPHDGKNISQEQLVDAMMVGVSQDRSISVGLFAAAVRTNPSGDNASFSLPDLGRHNILEHDASLSRKDAAVGDPIPFDESVFAQTKATWAGLDNIDISASAQGRAVQIRNSMNTNPQFSLSPVARAFLAGESAAYLMVFGDAETGVAPRLAVEYFFENEQFPPDYKPPTKVVTSANLRDLSSKINTILTEEGLLPNATATQKPQRRRFRGTI